MVYFVDTSGLAKRYIHEQGSLWTISWMTPATGNYARATLETPINFISSDVNLLLVATAEGFAVDNPNLHQSNT